MLYRDEIVEEVRRHRAELLEKYGGIEGYHKHLDEQRPRWEKEGRIYVTPEEVRARRERTPVSADEN